MKKIILILFMSIVSFLFIINNVRADACTQPGYVYCWENSYTFNEATAHAKIYFSIEDDAPGDGYWSQGYVINRLFARVGFEGDKLYFYENLPNWDYAESRCDENGCTGGSQISSGEYLLASLGEEYTDCPAFHVWDRDDAPNGDWAWATAGYGWAIPGNCFNWKVVECVENADCGSGQVCKKSGSWQEWSCQTGVECPSSVNYNPAKEINVKGCSVWQYFSEYSHCTGSGWYIYTPDAPSNLMITEQQYRSVAPPSCWEGVGCTTDADCEEGQTCNLETNVCEYILPPPPPSPSTIILYVGGAVLLLIVLIMVFRMAKTKKRRK